MSPGLNIKTKGQVHNELKRECLKHSQNKFLLLRFNGGWTKNVDVAFIISRQNIF